MAMKPQGDSIRNAVKWVSEEQQYNPEKKRRALIDEACVKFNLSPMDAEFLARCLTEQKKPEEC